MIDFIRIFKKYTAVVSEARGEAKTRLKIISLIKICINLHISLCLSLPISISISLSLSRDCVITRPTFMEIIRQYKFVIEDNS